MPGRAWAIASTIASIAISICALVVSIFAYQDQRDAYLSVVAGAHRADAELVSFAASTYSYDQVATIQNLGQAPIYDVSLDADVLVSAPLVLDPGETEVKRSAHFPVLIGTIPPCSISTINLSDNLYLESAARMMGASQNMIAIYPLDVRFTDANGSSWLAGGPGQLKQVRPQNPESNYLLNDLGVHTSVQPAQGCA
jgi:hypothetical protein